MNLLPKQILMRNPSPQDRIKDNPHHTHPPTPHPTNKITISFPAQHTHYDEEDSNTPVQVYLHCPNHKSLKLQLSPKIPLTQIKTIVEQQIGISKDRQLLYLNGKNITEYGHIRLQSNSIIHISNINQLCQSNQEIHMKVTIMNFVEEKHQKVRKNFVALPNELISDFLTRLQKEVKHLFAFKTQEVHYFLLESSRLLQKQKTFAEQEVTCQSNIICMLTKHEVKTRFTNDTKQEILHDISELLGFSQETQNKPEPKHEERSIRPRYSRQQAKRQVAKKEPDDQSCSYSSAQNLSSFNVPNFKKKATPISKAMSFEDSPTTLAKKIKSKKSKRDLDFLLNSQQKQKLVFESPEVIKQEARQSQKREDQSQVKQTPADVVRSAPQIPKVMPINQRRQIRMEIQKLFDFNDSAKSKISLGENTETKEQKKPISPPTEVPKPKEKMRLSMGSRPAFLDQLRNLREQ